MRAVVLAAMVVTSPVFGQGASAGEAPSASSSGAQIRFEFENAQLQPSRFDMVIHEDGSGHFQSVTGPISVKDSGGIEAGPLNRDIAIQEPLLSTLFATAHARKNFAVECEAKAKVAYRGNKILSYQGPDGHGTCTFNWSKDNQIQKLADQLESVAMTLEYGRRLEVEHQHNRLGLDAELEFLADAVKDGQALEIENIAPTLQSIVDDETVMNRARQRAKVMLSGAKSR
jgi:hypothetical protein